MEAELKRGGAKGSRGVAPVLSGSVSDSLSVFTLSKSICHRNCGTKREGSLPGRTHSERNEEKTRQPQMGRSEGLIPQPVEHQTTQLLNVPWDIKVLFSLDKVKSKRKE